MKRTISPYLVPAVLLLLWAFSLGAFGMDEERYFFIVPLTVIALLLWKGLAAVRAGTLTFPRTAINLPIALFLITILLSLFTSSVYPYATRLAFLKWFSYIAMIYLLARALSDEQIRRVFVGGILFIGLAYTMSAFIFRGYFIQGFKLYANGQNIVSLTEGHNLFVGVVAMLFFLWLGLTLSFRHKYKLMALGALPFGLAIFLSTSRGGVVVLALISVIFGLLLVVQKIRLTPVIYFISVTAAVILGIAQLATSQSWQHLQSLFSNHPDANIRSRGYYAQASFNQIMDHPLLGSGAGTYEYIIQQFKHRFMVNHIPIHPDDGLPIIGVYYNALGKHLHNDHLQLTAETGIIGYALIGWAMLAIVFPTLQTFRQAGERQRILMLGIACAVLSILLNCLTDLQLQTPINALLLCFCLGIMLGTVMEHAKTPPYRFIIPNPYRPVFCGGIILFAAIGAWFAVKPALAFLHYQKAVAAAQSDPLTAIAEMERALFIEASNAEYWGTEGIFWQQLADTATGEEEQRAYLEKARLCIQRAIARCPVRSYYYSQLAVCEAQLGHPAAQLAALETAATLSPTHPQTLDDLIGAYLSRGQLLPATSYIEKLFTIIGQGIDENALAWEELSRRLAGLAENLDQHGYPLAMLENLLPEDPYVLQALGQFWQKRGDLAAAIRLHRHALPLFPDTRVGRIYHAHACQTLGNYLYQTGEINQALDLYEQAFEIVPSEQNALRHLEMMKRAGREPQAAHLAQMYLQQFQSDERIARFARQLLN